MTKVTLDVRGSDPDLALGVGDDGPPSYDDLIAALDERDWPTIGTGASRSTWCPSCEGDDSNSPSLSLSRGSDGRLLVHCHKSECGLGAILAGFESAPVPERAMERYRRRFRSGRPSATGQLRGAKITARFKYGSAVKVRYTFPDGWRTFRWSPRKPAGELLYRPPTKAEVESGEVIFVVEGEHDVDTLRGLGLIACSPSEGNLTPTMAEAMRGCRVAVLRDHDAPGLRKRDAALRALDGIAEVAFAVELPGFENATDGRDVSDWLDSPKGSPAKLRKLVKAAAAEAQLAAVPDEHQEHGDADLDRGQIDARVESLRIDAAARRELAADGFEEPPSRFTVADELKVNLPLLVYIIEGLLHAGANATLTALFKVGKTTFFLNLFRSLADGEPFLDRFATKLGKGRRVALWNFEMTDTMLRAWLRDADLARPERAAVLNLRGHRLPITTPAGEDYAVRWLAEREVEVWLLDTYARAMADCGLDENSNSDAETFTRTLDRIKRRAGVSALVMSAHTGRTPMEEGKERSRGATRLDDWADARWLLTTEGEARFLRATGRDIELPEAKLAYHARDRSLRIVRGDRKSERLDADVQAVWRAVVNDPGITARALRDAMPGRGEGTTVATRAAVAQGLIEVRRVGQRHEHHPAKKPPGAVVKRRKR